VVEGDAMLCAAMKVWKRTASWRSARLPTPFTFSACPALCLDRFGEFPSRPESFLATGAEGVEVISALSVLSVS